MQSNPLPIDAFPSDRAAISCILPAGNPPTAVPREASRTLTAAMMDFGLPMLGRQFLGLEVGQTTCGGLATTLAHLTTNSIRFSVGT